MRVDIDITGVLQVEEDLEALGDRGGDMRPVLYSVVDDLLGLEARQFASEGRFASGGWAPLAPSTVAAKRRRGQPARILEATGRLQRSLTRRGAPGQIRDVDKDGLRLATTVPYAKYHQHGTRRMPARPPVEVPVTSRRNILRKLQHYLLTGEVLPL